MHRVAIQTETRELVFFPIRKSAHHLRNWSEQCPIVFVSTARQVFEAFPIAAADIEIEPKDETPLDFARKLCPGARFEAIVYLAYLLPRREAVWWGCQCVRAIGGNKADDALLAAEAWVRDPDETRRRAALNLGWTRNARLATTWLALAAGQSGGSIAAEDAPHVPAPPQATALDVKAAVILAIAQSPPAGQLAWLSACVEAGIRFAEGGDAKVRAPAAQARSLITRRAQRARLQAHRQEIISVNSPG